MPDFRSGFVLVPFVVATGVSPATGATKFTGVASTRDLGGAPTDPCDLPVAGKVTTVATDAFSTGLAAATGFGAATGAEEPTEAKAGREAVSFPAGSRATSSGAGFFWTGATRVGTGGVARSE